MTTAVTQAIETHGAKAVYEAAHAAIDGDMGEALRAIDLPYTTLGSAWNISNAAYRRMTEMERASDKWRTERQLSDKKRGPKDSDRIRAALGAAGLSQRAAARELGIDERTVRRYCSGELPVPQVVWLALEALRRKTPAP